MKDRMKIYFVRNQISCMQQNLEISIKKRGKDYFDQWHDASKKKQIKRKHKVGRVNFTLV